MQAPRAQGSHPNQALVPTANRGSRQVSSDTWNSRACSGRFLEVCFQETERRIEIPQGDLRLPLPIRLSKPIGVIRQGKSLVSRLHIDPCRRRRNPEDGESVLQIRRLRSPRRRSRSGSLSCTRRPRLFLARGLHQDLLYALVADPFSPKADVSVRHANGILASDAVHDGILFAKTTQARTQNVRRPPKSCIFREVAHPLSELLGNARSRVTIKRLCPDRREGLRSCLSDVTEPHGRTHFLNNMKRTSAPSKAAPPYMAYFF